ncbi:MAG: histidine--tRNA ligase [Candidatus Omnitrophica bacterium]|nr:histidine--tRNA ligase [Candidatus Omnitrophota bacterium]
MTKYQAIKGMSDILPEESQVWQRLEEVTRSFFRTNGYEEIRTPVVEVTELFQRSIGEASDIVHKEMYTFKDRGDRSMTLRPEMTASVARAVIENNLIREAKPLYLYYIGPMFRAERPQAGRRRQFHQVGIESINTPSPFSDAEAIALLARYLRVVGVESFKIKINTLGCPKDQAEYRETLKAYFSKESAALCEDCKYRLEKNVLRIFDCKNESCHKIIDNAPPMKPCGTCGSDFDTIRELLKSVFNVFYEVDRKLVRGLDYYTGCVFEATSAGLGAKDAVAAGGRYDNLIKEMGGADLPATGFAIGIERLLESMKADSSPLLVEPRQKRIYVALAGVGLDAIKRFSKVLGGFNSALCLLREKGHEVFFHFRPDVSLKSQLREADKWGARAVIILGEDELTKGVMTLKDFESKEEKKDIAISELVSIFRWD